MNLLPVIGFALLVSALAFALLYPIETDPTTPRRGLDSPGGPRPPILPAGDDPSPVNYDG